MLNSVLKVYNGHKQLNTLSFAEVGCDKFTWTSVKIHREQIKVMSTVLSY